MTTINNTVTFNGTLLLPSGRAYRATVFTESHKAEYFGTKFEVNKVVALGQFVRATPEQLAKLVGMIHRYNPSENCVGFCPGDKTGPRGGIFFQDNGWEGYRVYCGYGISGMDNMTSELKELLDAKYGEWAI